MQEERCLSCLYWLEPNFLISILSSNFFVYLIEIQKCYLLTNGKPYQLGPFIDSEHPEIRKVMMPFFNRTGLERLGVIGPEIGLPLGWSVGSECDTIGLLSLDVAHLYKDK